MGPDRNGWRGGGAGCGRGEAEQKLPSFLINVLLIKDQGARMKAGGTQRPASQDPEVQGSRIGSRTKDRNKDQVSRIKDEGGRLDPDAGTSAPRGSRIKDKYQ